MGNLYPTPTCSLVISYAEQPAQEQVELKKYIPCTGRYSDALSHFIELTLDKQATRFKMKES